MEDLIRNAHTLFDDFVQITVPTRLDRERCASFPGVPIHTQATIQKNEQFTQGLQVISVLAFIMPTSLCPINQLLL
jgi:hypothetical protein